MKKLFISTVTALMLTTSAFAADKIKTRLTSTPIKNDSKIKETENV